MKKIITKDADELLKIIYEDYVSDSYPNFRIKPDYLLKKTEWDGLRIKNALIYLKKQEYIKLTWLMGKHPESLQKFAYGGMLPKGIVKYEKEMEEDLKMKNQMFVQLGLKKNGRIVKNEQYSLDEFLKLVTGYGSVTPEEKKLSFFDRLNKSKVERAILFAKMIGRSEGVTRGFDYMKDCIINLIKSDNFGKKKRVKKHGKK